MLALIREGTADEVESCVALWTRVISARDGSQVIREVSERAHEAFHRSVLRFAVVGEGPNGFALTVMRAPSVALLSRICVDPRMMSHGVGTALVHDAVHHARRAGLDRLELDVRVTNTRATALYERAGFVTVSEPWAFDAGDPVETWSLNL
ncbi:MAG: GNAT family N-acetyltransferase [Ornithinimicrobium sp.]